MENNVTSDREIYFVITKTKRISQVYNIIDQDTIKGGS